MTFKEFAEKAKTVRPFGGTFEIRVEMWLDGEGFRDLIWTLYSADLQKHFSAPTPEQVLELYAEKTKPEELKGLAEVGEVAVP